MFGKSKALVAALIVGFAPVLAAAETWTVTRVTVDDRKAVIATVEPVHELPARARIGGTIAELKVKEGDGVAAGDRIALVVDPKLSLQMQGLDARIQAQEAQRDQARLDFNRAKELRSSGTVTQARLDQAQTQLDIAERNLKALHSERDVIVQQSAEGAILAPGPGRILKVPVAAGSVVLPGDTIATIAADNYILRLQLPERHARFMKAGDTILIGARGLQEDAPETLRRGTVKLVYPEIEQGRVIADVNVEGLGDYFVGERTRVYVSTGTREALIVPQDFVYRRFGVSYVKLADGTEVVVQVGMPDAKGIEILSGLHEGDVVAKP
jgi:membrane fusion protein, multidrug efflux system